MDMSASAQRGALARAGVADRNTSRFVHGAIADHATRANLLSPSRPSRCDRRRTKEMIRAITPITASALFALAIGCNNPAEKQVNERSEARKEINQAGQDAQEKVQNAREDLAEAE